MECLSRGGIRWEISFQQVVRVCEAWSRLLLGMTGSWPRALGSPDTGFSVAKVQRTSIF